MPAPLLIPLILDAYYGAGNSVDRGSAILQPITPLTDTTSHQVIYSPLTVALASPPAQVMLRACDDPSISPSGWQWTIWFQNVPGNPPPFSFSLKAGYTTFTCPEATPAVFTLSAGSAPAAGTPVQLAGASLPGGFTTGTTYYVTGPSGSTFSLAATAGGGALAATSDGSGTVGSEAAQYLSSMQAEVTSGGIASVTAGDASIVIGGTGTAPTVETGTLDKIAQLHPPIAPVGFNGQKATGLANGSTATDAVAYGQLGSAAFTSSGAYDAAGAAATAQSNAETYAAAQASAAQSAAEAASVPASALPLPTTEGGTGLDESTLAALLTAILAAGGGTIGAFLAPKVVTLTGTSVTPDASQGNVFEHALTGNTTYSAPVNPKNGQTITIRPRQPASGGPYTVTFAAGAAGDYSGGSGTIPAASTAANDVDIFAFTYDANAGDGTGAWCCLNSGGLGY